MWDLIKQHPKSVLVAVLIHLFLLAFFIVSVDWHHEVPAAAQPIKATMVVDAKEVDRLKSQLKPEPPEPPEKQVEELKQQEEAERLEQARIEEQKRQEAEKQAALLQQQEEAKKKAELEKKQQQEKQRLAEVKRKKEAEKKKQAELKRKQEAERQKKLAEEKRKKAEALKRKKEAERKKKLAAEKKRKAAERKKKLAEQKRRKEEERLRAAEMAAEEERMAQLLAEDQSDLEQARMAGLKSQYMAAIKSRVESRWLQPSGGVTGSCEVKVKQASTGTVLDVQVLPSSTCNESMRQSVEKAVWRADPMPRAPDVKVFDREIKFIFEPQT